jgi:hypothetical protein
MTKEFQMPNVKAATYMTAKVSSFELGDSLVISASSFVILLTIQPNTPLDPS